MLVAFIACEALHGDEDEMRGYNQLEVLRLLRCATYVYYAGCVFHAANADTLVCFVFDPAEVRRETRLLAELALRYRHVLATHVGCADAECGDVSGDTPRYCLVFEWLVARIQKQEGTCAGTPQKWDLLVGSHIALVAGVIGTGGDPASAGEKTFTTHSGRRAEIPFRIFTDRVPTRTLFLDCCAGNQINLEDVRCDYVVCSRASVGYVGLVGENFAAAYPNIGAVLRQAKPGAQWCVIVL